MPNPGSPQAMQTRQNMPAMPKGTMIGMFMVLIIMMVVMMFRKEIGGALNVIFEPLIGFGGKWPVFTLVIAGLIMITLSTIIRSFMTDFVGQARNQKISSEFNKEMRQARLENNLFKLKKLQEEQPKMMARSMESSTQMMRVMPITMLVIIPIYAWVGYFLGDPSYGFDASFVPLVPHELLTAPMPWGTVGLVDRLAGFFPIWIVVYTMISLPVGQLENRVVRYYLLKKRMRDLEAGITETKKVRSSAIAEKTKNLFGKAMPGRTKPSDEDDEKPAGKR
jgi:uncharacterized membrane protein (DUF106 family)